MEDELEVIRDRMEETRSSLADKVDALEGKIMGTVESATSSVAETVETVKEKVEETVETVKEAFNLRRHIERHPWLAMGASVATGYFAGSWLLLPSPPEALPPPPAPVETRPPREYSTNGNHGNGRAQVESDPEEEEPGFLQTGLELLKGLAVGSVMGLVRDMVTHSAPQSMVEDLTKLVDDVTTRLGGKPLGKKDDEEGEQKGADIHAERESPEMGRPMGTARW